MTKRELIKEAWRGKNDKINEDGWLYFGYACNGWDDVEDWLEDNNGWIKIKSEDDLPEKRN